MTGVTEEIMVAVHGIWRRRWLALGVGWAIALIGWLAISLVPNAYESEARILVAGPGGLGDSVGISPAERQANLDAVRQNLTSGSTLAEIVKTTDLIQRVATERDVGDKAAMLARNIKVTAEQDNLFHIAVRVADSGLSDAGNARVAHQVGEKLVAAFVGGGPEAQADAGRTLKFLDAQLDQRARQLADAEATRAEFAEKYLGSLPGTGTIADRIDAARSEMSRVDADLTAAQSALAAVNGQLGATPASTRGVPIVTGGGPSATSAIEAQIADGRARGWTDQHPDMIALNSQLARVRAMGGGGGGVRVSAGAVIPNPAYMSLRSMQAEKAAVAGALSGRKAQLQGDINRVVAAQAADPEVSAEQTRVERDYSILKDQYDKLLASREQVKLRQDVQGGGSGAFRVIDGPTAPRSPVAPNRPLLLTIVLIAALVGGAGAAFGIDRLRPTYSTAARLAQASGLPVLGAIGEVLTLPEATERQRQVRMFAGGAAALGGVFVVLLAIEFIQRAMVA